jgi:hypothetical protein
MMDLKRREVAALFTAATGAGVDDLAGDIPMDRFEVQAIERAVDHVISFT